jgi:hypothetical protein
MLFVPLLGHMLIPIAWIIDYGAKDLYQKFSYFVWASILLTVLIIVSIFTFIDWIRGTALIGVLILVGYYIQTVYQYFTSDFFLEPKRLLAT